MRLSNLFLVSALFLMLILSASMCVAEDNSSAVSVALRPTEPTALKFDQQIVSAQARGGLNSQIDLVNYPGSGTLVLTPSATFTSGFCHLIFEDGHVLTLSIYADPTAPTTQQMSATRATSSAPAVASTSVSTTSEAAFNVPASTPAEAKELMRFLNSLENAQQVWLKYRGPLQGGLRATVTRVLRNRATISYEVEVENESTLPVTLSAMRFSNYLSKAVAISGMDHHGTKILEPGQKTFVYIVTSSKSAT